MEENNVDYGPFEWYKAKTIEEMRNDLVDMANGNYFEDDKQYAFMSSGKLVVRTGKELNDQIPEGYSAEEVLDFNDYMVVARYVKDIKQFVEYDKEVDGFNIQKDGKEFAGKYLQYLDQLNQVVYIPGNPLTRQDVERGLDLQDGMVHASEIQTGAIDDYIQTGFKSVDEFYEWYLSDVAPYQSVLESGQTQAEDLSIVDKGFYGDELTEPNSRFPRKEVAEKNKFKEETEELRNKYPMSVNYNNYKRPDKFSISQQEQALKPEINPLQKGQQFIDLMADMRRINPKVQRTQVKPERRRFF